MGEATLDGEHFAKRRFRAFFLCVGAGVLVEHLKRPPCVIFVLANVNQQVFNVFARQVELQLQLFGERCEEARRKRLDANADGRHAFDETAVACHLEAVIDVVCRLRQWRGGIQFRIACAEPFRHTPYQLVMITRLAALAVLFPEIFSEQLLRVTVRTVSVHGTDESRELAYDERCLHGPAYYRVAA